VYGLTLADQARRRGLRQMKSVAGGLLIVAAVIYLFSWRWEQAGGPAWVGYLRSAAEAGMVGGLADWFAVTALFRRPLGLPIPHTAIIPTKKDALGQNLGDFIGSNFLSADVIRERLHQADVVGRVSGWLAEPAHADRVAAEVAAAARGALNVLSDEDVQAVLEQAVVQRVVTMPIGPPLGRLLDQIVAEKAHHRLVDLLVDAGHEWLLRNRDAVIDLVTQQAPTWSPRFVDARVAAKVYTELVRVAGEIRTDGAHPARRALDRALANFADDLRLDPETMARVEAVKAGLLNRPEVRQAFRDLLGAARRLVMELIDDPGSELRQRLSKGLAGFGRRLGEDPALRAKVEGWLDEAASYVVTNYRDELTRTITDTVKRWDAEETSRKIELQVGRDLQFIRLNGTIVGALAGLAIHAVTQLLL
jgi:uncharacterized membrane-anchored protein YjiN (DUF445 family)